MSFRFIDRWQGRLRVLFPAGAANDELVAALELRDRSLEAHLEAPGWSAPTLLNSWVDFGGTEQVAQFRKVGDMVQIRGVIKSGTVGFSNAFVLPAGLWPPANLPFAIQSNGAVAGLYVTSSGQVQVFFGSNVSAGINCQFSVTA